MSFMATIWSIVACVVILWLLALVTKSNGVILAAIVSVGVLFVVAITMPVNRRN